MIGGIKENHEFLRHNSQLPGQNSNPRLHNKYIYIKGKAIPVTGLEGP
jgi:hypothetical protein